MRTKTLLPLLLGGILASGNLACGQSATDNALLQILVRKGIVTQEEAAQIQKEAADQAAAQAAAQTAQAPAPAAPSYGGGSTVVTASTPSASAVGNTTAAGFNSSAPGSSSLSFKIGKADFTPFGFMDFTGIYRSGLDGGDIGSSFGGIPYGNSAGGNLSETRFSAKNSRIGLRVDSKFGDTKVLGYLEADFLGQTPSNVNVASNSDTMRMRVYFVDVQNGPWEFLAGQDWSMMTPNRKGLSPLPSDIFYTQNVDTNYQVGLVWGRTPQVRAVYHATDELTLGLSLENPDQYVGSAVTLPTTAGFTSSQLDIGTALPSTDVSVPSTFPDVIGKIAYDTKLGDLPFHFDAAGLVRYFRINTYTAAVNADSTATGVSGSANAILNILPHLSLIGNVFGGNGAGRYLSTGLGPDVMVNPVNSAGVYTLSTVSSYAYMAGLEWDVLPATKLSAYYGAVDFGRKYDQTGPTSYIGYGYPGSANSNNRQIEEYTLDLSQVLWKNASYGDLKLLAQVSYLDREAWYVPANTPAKGKMGIAYIDVRYDLP